MHPSVWENVDLMRTSQEDVVERITKFFYGFCHHGSNQLKAVDKSKSTRMAITNKELEQTVLTYDHDFLYLEKQHKLCCWMHALGAILGNLIHPSMRHSSWLASALMAFIPINTGETDIIEPAWIIEMPNNAEHQIIALSVLSSIQQAIEPRIKLCTPLSTFNPDRPPGGTGAAMQTFLQMMATDFVNEGLTNIYAHRLFTSLNDPHVDEFRDGPNIYLGSCYLTSDEISNVNSLLASFDENNANVMIISYRLRSGSNLLHYVTVWKSDSTKSIAYYDPIVGYEDSQSSTFPSIMGFNVPKTLQNIHASVFTSDVRAAFFFKYDFNEHFTMDPVTQTGISDNLNIRLNSIVKEYFKVPDYAYQTIVQLSDTHYENCFKSNSTLVVTPSYMRNNHTGNSLGYGLRAKKPISKGTSIGSFNGKVIVLSPEEELAMRKTVSQFYTLALSLGESFKKKYRLENNQIYDPHVRYTAFLDCKDTAENGECMISLCNSPKDSYSIFGGRGEANATLVLRQGSIQPSLMSSKPISKGQEILWNYGTGMNLPQILEEEKTTKIFTDVSPTQWTFPFNREEVIKFLQATFQDQKEILTKAKKSLRVFTSDGNSTVQCYTYGINRELNYKHLAAHDKVPKPMVTLNNLSF